MLNPTKLCCLDFRNSYQQLRNTRNAPESHESNCIDGLTLLNALRRGLRNSLTTMVDQQQPLPKPSARLFTLRELCLRTLMRWMSRDTVLPLLQFAQEVHARHIATRVYHTSICRLLVVPALVAFWCYIKQTEHLLTLFFCAIPHRSNFQTAPLSLSNAHSSLLYVCFDFQSSLSPIACLSLRLEMCNAPSAALQSMTRMHKSMRLSEGLTSWRLHAYIHPRLHLRSCSKLRDRRHSKMRSVPSCENNPAPSKASENWMHARNAAPKDADY